jgi:hypothetical protein
VIVTGAGTKCICGNKVLVGVDENVTGVPCHENVLEVTSNAYFGVTGGFSDIGNRTYTAQTNNRVIVSGGAVMSVANTMFVNSNSVLEINSGSYTGNVSVKATGTLINRGYMRGAVTCDGDMIADGTNDTGATTVNGTLSIGSDTAAGTLTIYEADIVLGASAATSFDVFGMEDGDFDKIDSSATPGIEDAFLNGTLNVTFHTAPGGEYTLKVIDVDDYRTPFTSTNWFGLPPDATATFDNSNGIITYYRPAGTVITVR